ncbi:MAG: hypothetical protein WCC60_02135 [Ilumatobacteraceae bacterium]
MSTITSLRRRAALMTLALVGFAPLAIATTASAQQAAPARPAVARSFSCTGIISRIYTRQTVTGTITGLRPSGVSVLNYTNTVVHTKDAPARTNNWWGGTWKTGYQMNQWNLGKATDGTIYHLMLPDTAMGGTFDALLVSEFGGGAQGNWQNWMTCTAV